ncbi:hypothetical protein RUM44_012845 [Polyplax serrata]|uniref:Uncharacterized protein n=1 Tax=Polyplax serrata TaxID=468196 RepID=A0ABR1BG64_POLSC
MQNSLWKETNKEKVEDDWKLGRPGRRLLDFRGERREDHWTSEAKGSRGGWKPRVDKGNFNVEPFKGNNYHLPPPPPLPSPPPQRALS